MSHAYTVVVSQCIEILSIFCQLTSAKWLLVTLHFFCIYKYYNDLRTDQRSNRLSKNVLVQSSNIITM